MPNTPLAGLRYPDLTSAPNVPLDVGNLAADLDRKITVTVATAAARAAITGQYDGMRVYEASTRKFWLWDSSLGAWTEFAGGSAWGTYTPTWQTPGATTQPSIGNGILAGRFRKLDPHTGFLKLQLTIGTTSGGGSAPATSGYQLGFPSGWVNGPMSSALTGYFKGTGDSGPLGAFVSSGESRILEMRAAQNDAIVGNGLLTIPGDYIIVSGMVELA